MTFRARITSRIRTGGVSIGCAATLLGALSAGCGDLLEVSDPDIVRPEDLTDEAGLRARRAGAFGDFAKAYGGDATPSDADEGQILATGLLGDELKKTGTDPQRIAWDARQLPNTSGHLSTYFEALHRARQAAESTAAVWAAAEGMADAMEVVAEMNNLAAFISIFLGEAFCSGVPVSGLTPAGDIEYGEPLTTAQLFERADQHFDEALSAAQSSGNADLENLARIGKGRALLNLAQFSEAAAAVAPVPTAFRYDVRYSTNTRRQENGVYYANVTLERWSVVDGEGGNGIDYLGAYENGDPRTPFVVAPDSVGFDQTSGTQYYQQLYTERSAPIPLATGIEARLIEAEGALNAGDLATFEQIHNTLRAGLDVPAVAPVDVASMSAEERVDFHFRERALWMWLTGHRLGDMRRLVRQYGRAAESVFPSGQYFRPQFPTYGADTNFPVPVRETNNPNFTQCIDRNA